MKADIDVLIIGAGPAGSCAASMLQKEGFKLLVVEKQIFPRFVIGESLIPSCMDMLKEADLLDAVEAQGSMRKCGAVFRRGEEICNFDFSNQFTDGWKYTFQVTRSDFDKAMADTVATRGVEILYNHGVTAVDFHEHGANVTIEQPDKTTRKISARFVLDCSGYGRVLPRLLDLEKPSNFPIRESLFTHVTGDKRPLDREEGKIWACIHPEGAWVWIIPFSNGKTSVGVVGTPEFFKRYSGNSDEQLRAILMADPNVAARLSEMQFVFPAQRITAFACGVKKLHGPHFALAGNSTEFLDPIFSSGVTLAIASANRAAKVITRELRDEAVNWDSDYTDYVMQGINTFRAYVTAWYDETLPDIIFASQANRDIMQQVCSVLAGYVWDNSNPYVSQPERALPILAKIVRGKKQREAASV